MVKGIVMFKILFIKLFWILRGKPTKTVTGGWCGCCGKWIFDAKFIFPDYHMIDNFYDLNSICPKCGEQQHSHKIKE
jgi:hypothetical protein